MAINQSITELNNELTQVERDIREYRLKQRRARNPKMIRSHADRVDALVERKTALEGAVRAAETDDKEQAFSEAYAEQKARVDSEGPNFAKALEEIREYQESTGIGWNKDNIERPIREREALLDAVDALTDTQIATIGDALSREKEMVFRMERYREAVKANEPEWETSKRYKDVGGSLFGSVKKVLDELRQTDPQYGNLADSDASFNALLRTFNRNRDLIKPAARKSKKASSGNVSFKDGKGMTSKKAEPDTPAKGGRRAPKRGKAGTGKQRKVNIQMA